MDREQPASEPLPEGSGIGGGLRYIREVPSSRMVNQEHNFSCVVAGVRQLLRDAGVEIPEAELIDRIGMREEFGSELEPAAATLSALHPRLVYAAGSVEPEVIHQLVQGDPWIARVRTLSGRNHIVIVDDLGGNLLWVRDPWGLTGPGSGSGTVAILRIGDFLEHWQFGIHEAIIPIGLKTRSRA